jgi:hypothetical protein
VRRVTVAATDVEVAFATGEPVRGEVRASDPETDRALVESTGIAMGSPLGFQNT